MPPKSLHLIGCAPPWLQEAVERWGATNVRSQEKEREALPPIPCPFTFRILNSPALSSPPLLFQMSWSSACWETRAAPVRAKQKPPRAEAARGAPLSRKGERETQ